MPLTEDLFSDGTVYFDGSTVTASGTASITSNVPELAEGSTRNELYGGEVIVDFNPNSPRYRYKVTDFRNPKIKESSARGVTTVLRDIIHKPDLMMWAMNMSHGKLFGAKWNEDELKYIYTPKDALLKPGETYTEEKLQSLMEEGAKAHRDRSDRGKDIGTLVHRAIELYLKGNSSMPVEAAIDEHGEEVNESNTKATVKAFDAFVEWWTSLPNAKVVSTEKVVYSRMMNYSGTCDLVAEIDGKLYMLDIKTTNSSKKAPLGIYAEYFMQLGGYAHAYREETGKQFDDLGIIRVSKEGQLSVATSVDMGIEVDDCERMFAFAIRIHDWLEKTSHFLTDKHFKSHLIGLTDGRESDSN